MDIALQRPEQGSAILTLTGRLDLGSAPSFREAITRTVHDGSPRVVVDLSHVPFIDSSGLGALVGGLQQAKDAGGELRIAGALPEVLDVLALMRLDRVLPPYRTLDDALQGL